jgi:hypothetical protein
MGVDHQHNSDKYGISWGNLDIMKGLAKGSLVGDSGITGGWTWKGDSTGGGVYSFDPDQSGTLTFQVESANLLHQQLLAIWNADRSLRNSVADIAVTNEDTQEERIFHNARIQRPPPFALDTESPIQAWPFLYTGTTYKPSLAQNNVIGVGVTPALPPGP